MSGDSRTETTRQRPSPSHIAAACARIGHLLGNNKYAVVGGAACQVLGSPRPTEQVDFVVVKGAVAATRRLLAADKDSFTVEPRTLYTHYNSVPPVEIRILSPPGTFKEDFVEASPSMAVTLEGGSVTILQPVLILNSKCRSILERVSIDKRTSDALDIKFLMQYLLQAGTFPTREQLPNASKAFIEWFASTFGDTGFRGRIKWDPATGWLTGA